MNSKWTLGLRPISFETAEHEVVQGIQSLSSIAVAYYALNGLTHVHHHWIGDDIDSFFPDLESD